ncbi:hypothetical protein TIFTF001_012403 [Ficus carica]|uniref:Uncharacterized protein n=1 Tax=Ficus carica TaxID=3494 RepID=A0AA88D3N5_FICCA|nr:hypothetical protein TIFTF001_012403 [Ficus carica]
MLLISLLSKRLPYCLTLSGDSIVLAFANMQSIGIWRDLLAIGFATVGVSSVRPRFRATIILLVAAIGFRWVVCRHSSIDRYHESLPQSYLVRRQRHSSESLKSSD